MWFVNRSRYLWSERGSSSFPSSVSIGPEAASGDVEVSGAVVVEVEVGVELLNCSPAKRNSFGVAATVVPPGGMPFAVECSKLPNAS
jgi:hypothetical protein